VRVRTSYVKLYMMKQTKGNVSIVVPVYNEEAQIRLCLDAIANQTVKPFEVIVVDNNSTDNTVAIARSYPFVTVMTEKRQGVVYARDTGFDAAKGQIIGRLDGDSVIAPDWVAKVQEIFADPVVEAVSGQISYRNIGLPRLVGAIDHVVRTYLTNRMSSYGEQFLYGSNMAIRRPIWRAVRSQVCRKRRLHEDIDLAAHMVGSPGRVIFREDLKASIFWRQSTVGPLQFWGYVWSNDLVFAEHSLKSRRYARRAALAISCLYVPIYILHKGYDPHRGSFSLYYLLMGMASARPSPVSDSL